MKILFEDDDFLVLDKPHGVLVEGVKGGEQTLTDFAIAHSGERTRAAHRLDRDTTGVVLFAKNSKWNRELAEIFEKKRIRKEYWAIVRGKWNRSINKVETMIRRTENGRWENSKENGKVSTTTFRVMGSDEQYSWVQALPKTGRTHQIRLHCLEACGPIVGDRFYSDDSENPLLLHARSLSFAHPGGRGDLRFESDPPEYWKKWLDLFS